MKSGMASKKVRISELAQKNWLLMRSSKFLMEFPKFWIKRAICASALTCGFRSMKFKCFDSSVEPPWKITLLRIRLELYFWKLSWPRTRISSPGYCSTYWYLLPITRPDCIGFSEVLTGVDLSPEKWKEHIPIPVGKARRMFWVESYQYLQKRPRGREDFTGYIVLGLYFTTQSSKGRRYTIHKALKFVHSQWAGYWSPWRFGWEGTDKPLGL